MIRKLCPILGQLPLHLSKCCGLSMAPPGSKSLVQVLEQGRGQPMATKAKLTAIATTAVATSAASARHLRRLAASSLDRVARNADSSCRCWRKACLLPLRVCDPSLETRSFKISSHSCCTASPHLAGGSTNGNTWTRSASECFARLQSAATGK